MFKRAMAFEFSDLAGENGPRSFTPPALGEIAAFPQVQSSQSGEGGADQGMEQHLRELRAAANKQAEAAKQAALAKATAKNAGEQQRQ